MLELKGGLCWGNFLQLGKDTVYQLSRSAVSRFPRLIGDSRGLAAVPGDGCGAGFSATSRPRTCHRSRGRRNRLSGLIHDRILRFYPAGLSLPAQKWKFCTFSTNLLKTWYQWTNEPMDQRTNGPMDQRTNRRTDKASHRVACLQVKEWLNLLFFNLPASRFDLGFHPLITLL